MRILIALLIVFTAFPAVAKTYDKDYFGEQIRYRADYEDTLIHLARNNGLGFVELRAANPTLDPWIPGAGAKIILPKRHILPDAPRRGLVINLAEMRIFYFKNPGEAPLTFPISIGREGLKTPTGSTKIVRKTEGPTWRPTDRMRKEDPTLPVSVGPGPDNPLGTHALYLGWPQYLIHGTNKPYGIGRRVSSGCMRMYPEQITELYPIVPVGTRVTVVDQPVKVGWIEGELYIEVSPTQDQSLKIEEDGQADTYEITKKDIQRINEKAGADAEYLDWSVIRQAVKEHRGYPVKILSKNSRSKNNVIKQRTEAKSEFKVSESKVEKKQTAKKAEDGGEEVVSSNDWSTPKIYND